MQQIKQRGGVRREHIANSLIQLAGFVLRIKGLKRIRKAFRLSAPVSNGLEDKEQTSEADDVKS